MRERGAALRAALADLLQRTDRGVDLAVAQEQGAERDVQLVASGILADLRFENARGADDVALGLEKAGGLDRVAAALVGAGGRPALADALEQARGPEVIAAALEVIRDALGLDRIADERGQRALGAFVVLALERERQRASEVAAAERFLGCAAELARALEERARGARVAARARELGRGDEALFAHETLDVGIHGALSSHAVYALGGATACVVVVSPSSSSSGGGGVCEATAVLPIAASTSVPTWKGPTERSPRATAWASLFAATSARMPRMRLRLPGPLVSTQKYECSRTSTWTKPLTG